MVGSVYSGLIVLVDWLIKLFVFHKISGLKWEIKKDSAILVVILLMSFFVQGLALYVESFYLLFILVFLLRPNWKLSQYLFYGLIPNVLVDLFQRMTGIFTVKYFLVFNENVSINDFIFILVSLLIFLPVYFLFIRIMRIDFENINIVFGNKIYKRIVYAINTFLLVYCLAINPIMIWNREAQFSFQIPNVSLYIDVIPFYLFFFIVVKRQHFSVQFL